MAGGIASGTTVNGGNEQGLSGGTAVGATVSNPGYLVVSSGGTVNGATISGATLEITSGGLTGSSAITYSGGAALKLDASVSFGGTIAGFAVGDFLDMADIAFTSATTLGFTEAGNNLSGTLTVSDSVHTATLTLLGQYMAARFTAASDGHGGTVITDPPSAASGLVALEPPRGNHWNVCGPILPHS